MNIGRFSYGAAPWDALSSGKCRAGIIEGGGDVGELVDDGTGGLTGKIIGAAITVHRHFGPGLLEKADELCLAAELEHLGLRVRRQVPVPLIFRNIRLECGYRIDLLVEDLVVVEVKAVERLAPVHVAQVMTYLGVTDLHVGLLFNFNVKALAAGGFRRILRKHE